MPSCSRYGGPARLALQQQEESIEAFPGAVDAIRVEVREVQVVVEVREVQVVEVREVQVVVGEMTDSVRYIITTRGRFCNRSISSNIAI